MQLPESPLPAEQIAVAEAQFATSCKQLISIARINAASVEAVLEPGTFDHDDRDGEAIYAADAVAFAVAQTGHFLRALQLLAIDYECINAAGSALADRG